MDFTRRKLPQEEADKLRSVAIHDVNPFVPMPGPVYVFMRRNQKFVSVKAPLDFFLPEELERLNTFGEFYLPEFIDTVAPFIRAARQVRAVLEWQPVIRSARSSPPRAPVAFAPASFEISDTVLRILGPLWASPQGTDVALIEPYFTAVFASELCDPLPSECLREGRERDVIGYERALLHAGWAVFLALHLGYTNLAFLNSLYERVFRSHALGEKSSGLRVDELEELVAFAAASVDGHELQPVIGSEWVERGEVVARKLVARLQRVTSGMIPKGSPIPTIYGERGFVDV